MADPPHPPRGRLTRSPERGSGTVELTIATPLLMLLILGIVQFATWSHATHIAQAAASQGLAAARVDGGTNADGHEAAASVLAQLADGPLEGPGITVTRGEASAAVAVTGTAAAVVPFLNLPVHAEAAGPVERWTTG